MSIDRNLMESAKEEGLVLSTLLEDAIREELKKKAEDQWLKENRESISRYNKRIAAEGVFGDGLRTF